MEIQFHGRSGQKQSAFPLQDFFSGIALIIYEVMKYRKIMVKYNVYLKKLYFTAVKI